MADQLVNVDWRCSSAPAGSRSPFDSGRTAVASTASIIPAAVPGTVAGALLAAGRSLIGRDLDAEDWWYRCEFDAPVAPVGDGCSYWLEFDGLATIADVWLNGSHVLRSENMFLPQVIEVSVTQLVNELLIRFSALSTSMQTRRPRPRWKVARLRWQNLRWVRTSLLGRLIGGPEIPAPVGPWRAIRIRTAQATTVHTLRADVQAGVGVVELSITIPEVLGSAGPTVSVGSQQFDLMAAAESDRYEGTFHLADVQLWWPHTHGEQPLYPVHLSVDGTATLIGTVGFRSISVDRSEGNFAISVNGVQIFCRGAYWSPIDTVTLAEDPDSLRAALQQVRAGSMNMLRIGGETVYAGAELLRLCDELGLMIWQDCMFAFFDIPADAQLLASIGAELDHQLRALAGHPCVTVVSGGSEIEQQAEFYGVRRGAALGAVHHTLLPQALARLLPGVPSVTSSPTGGEVPTSSREGVAHYFGVGAYLRPPQDARLAAVRFAAECLSFSNPPERDTVTEAFGGASQAGHSPAWKAAVYRDAGASWDFEDVRQYYMSELFGPTSNWLRFSDAERALDLGRATVAELFTRTLSEWRRPGSTCSGALVYHHHDAVPGAGLGMVDALGRPKSVWYAMRRNMSPVAVLMTDEGLDGLDAHVVNDMPERFSGRIQVDLYVNGDLLAESAERDVDVAGHGHETFALDGMFDGFRDLNHAHHFGPVVYDVVVVSIVRSDPDDRAADAIGGPWLSQAVYTPRPAPLEADVGLTATYSGSAGTGWLITLSTRRFAQWVSIDCPGRIPEDSWFHLPPGESRTISLSGGPDDGRPPVGTVRALNSVATARIIAGD